MNEMLENHGGGNAWRGMVFGMNGRFLPGCDEMWKFWDTFGIEKAKMIGYWDKKCPVKPTLSRIKATVYQKPNEALIALAEWPEDDAPAARRNLNVPLIAVGSDVEAQTASFAKFGGDGKVVSASHQTLVKAAALPEGLKISFTCYQSEKPLAKYTARDANIWEDDSVEIFLQPDPAAKEYFKFTGNANGAIFDAGPGGSETTWNWQTSGPPNVAWNGNWNYQARTTPDGWAGEIFIRYADLGMKPPAPGDRIGFNICRGQQRPIPQLSGWSKPGVSFNNSGGFGVITFTSPAEATKEKVVDINKLYAPILTRLEIDWKALGMNSAECELYAPALKSFQSERTFGINDEIPIKPAEGMLLWLRQKK
jgi:cold shock CspA family protein